MREQNYPIPSTVIKQYPRRGPLQQFRLAEASAFRCFRCGKTKRSKLHTVYSGYWSRKLCNGCYGRLLSIYEIKAGSATNDHRIEQLSNELLALVSEEERREAERLFKASEAQAQALSPKALRFISTAEHAASQLESWAQLEWSPAVIGLCKAVEMEVVRRILEPLAASAENIELTPDMKDKDLGQMAAFCEKKRHKPPGLGVFAHFLQTVIHSQRRRKQSPLIRSFLRLCGRWVGSTWILESSGCHDSLTTLTKKYRNRAAHIDELSRKEYLECREFTIGNDGVIWKLILSTESHK